MNLYQVLGVSENASDDEIRAAYRELVKKYHPDKYQDNPLKNLADEKLKQINEAYDEIRRQRGSGYSGAQQSAGSSDHSYQYQYGSTGYAGESAADFARVRQLLNLSQVAQARAALERIGTRNAEWNYLYGIVLFRSGEYSKARDYLALAAQMDPNNAEYRSAYNSTTARGARSYHSYGDERGSGSLSSACGMCSTLWCLDSCCECFGGDLCRCM